MPTKHQHLGSASLVCTMAGEPSEGYIDKIFEIFESDVMVIKSEGIIQLDFSLEGVEDIPTYLRHVVSKLDDNHKDIGIYFKYAKVE